MKLTRVFIALGALNALAAVIAGALGAHALTGLRPAEQTMFQTATLYHFFHALGLLVIAALAAVRPTSVLLTWAGVLMFLGILAFSGSLYVSAVTGTHGVTALAPFGGVAFMIAWLLVALSSLKP